MPEVAADYKNKVCNSQTQLRTSAQMPRSCFVTEAELAALAKKFRLKAGYTKIKAAARLGVRRSSVQLAEEDPKQSLTRLRIRLIEAFSDLRITGPFFRLEKK